MSREKRRTRSGSGGVSRRTALALLAGGGLLSVGVSGAFDTVRLNRPFDLPVRRDDEALLRIELFDSTVESGGSISLMELTNGFSSSFEAVTVNVVSSGSLDVTVDTPLPTGTFTPGQRLPITATVSSHGDRTETVVLDIIARGATERIDARRSVEITCLGATEDGIAACSLESTGFETTITVSGSQSSEMISGEHNVLLTGSGRVTGDVDVTGTVDAAEGSEIDGDVIAGDTITISGGANVGGAITTGDSLEIANGGTLTGPPAPLEVCADLLLGGGPNLEATSVTVGGTLSNTAFFGQGRGLATTDSGFTVGGDFDFGGGAVVDSATDIRVDGSVDWNGNTLRTAGDLVVGGDLIVGQGSQLEVDGDIVVDGSVTMNGNRFEATGDLIVGGNLTVETGSSIDVSGTVHVDGTSSGY